MMDEGYEALNYKKNSEIYSQLGFLEELRQELTQKVEHKQSRIEAKMSLIERTRQNVFGQIDDFFNRIVEIAEQRKEKLKGEYLSIERKERDAFAASLDKVKQDSGDLAQISQAFTYFQQNFDDAEDFNKNTENLYFYKASFSEVQKQIERKANFYKMKKFQPSEFKWIDSDLVAVQNMGKIMNNSLAEAPLVLFDSQKFAAFEYRAKGCSFQELPLVDTENFAERIPKDFKSIYVGGPEQSYLLVGGFDIRKRQTSNAAFLYQRGKLKEVLEMYQPRQFFGICSNLAASLAAGQGTGDEAGQTKQHVFVIGGFNDSVGALKQVESFDLEKRKWHQHSAMNVERINPGCCTVDKQYVYVFGGRSADARADFYDSVERLNTDLNLWGFMKIRLPQRLCNTFAFTVKKDYIIVMGGLKRIQVDSRTGQVIDPATSKPVKPKHIRCEQQVDPNVYMYSQQKQVWFNLKPLSQQMKVCNVVPTGDCRFNCFLLNKQSSSEPKQTRNAQSTYPMNVVYDLKIICPRLDRYWHYEHLQKSKSRQLAQDRDSVNFLKSVTDSKGAKNQAQNQGLQSQQFILEGDTLMARNFEWERRHSNFRPEDLGQEMNAVIPRDQALRAQQHNSVTGDSLHLMTDFERAAVSGEVDMRTAQRALIQANKVSTSTENFAKVSLHLGKGSHQRDHPLVAASSNRIVEEAKHSHELPQYQAPTQVEPPFGQSLDEFVHLGAPQYAGQALPVSQLAINADAAASSKHNETDDDSEDDLMTAFK